MLTLPNSNSFVGFSFLLLTTSIAGYCWIEWQKRQGALPEAAVTRFKMKKAQENFKEDTLLLKNQSEQLNNSSKKLIEGIEKTERTNLANDQKFAASAAGVTKSLEETNKSINKSEDTIQKNKETRAATRAMLTTAYSGASGSDATAHKSQNNEPVGDEVEATERSPESRSCVIF